MAEKRKGPRSVCPACHKIIELDYRYKRRELVTCPFCKQVLEVVKEIPQVLDFPDDPAIHYSKQYPNRFG